MGTGWNQTGSGVGLENADNSITGIAPTYFNSINSQIAYSSSSIFLPANIVNGANAVTQGANLAAQLSAFGFVTTSNLLTGAITITNPTGGAIFIENNGNLAASGLSNSIAFNNPHAVWNPVNPNQVSGITPIYGANIAAGAFQVNGVNIGAIAAGTSAITQATNVIAAINAITAKTGVTASLNTSSGASPNSITLTNTNGNLIALSGDFSYTGLSDSTKPTNSDFEAAPTSFVNIAANVIEINGVPVGAITAGTDALTQGANIAAAINLVSAQTGVTAIADGSTGAVILNNTTGAEIDVDANTGIGGFVSTSFPTGTETVPAPTSFVNIPAGKIKINGVLVGAVTAGTDAITQAANIAAAINLVSAQSHVTATADATTGSITFSGGADIIVDGGSGLINSTVMNTGGRTGNGLANTSNVFYGTSNTNSGMPDISTQAGAAAAITSLATALDKVSTSQSSVAADQTALTTVSSTDASISQNIQNTIDSIQKPDVAALQMQLQDMNNQQSMNYYLINQMNTEAQAFLSIFR